MSNRDPLADLAGSWDAAPAPLSPAQRAAFAFERRLNRRRWQGAAVWCGLLLSQLPTWWQLNRDYNQIWNLPLLLVMHSFVLWLSLRPSLAANRAAFGLGLPFVVISTLFVSGSGGCCIFPYLGDGNLWLMPLLFGFAGVHLYLKTYLADHLDAREYAAFVHWHRAIDTGDPLEAAPLTPTPTPAALRTAPTPAAGRLAWICGVITALLMLPFSVMAVSDLVWRTLWHF